ncbi:MAG: alpha-keto acid decarboxylase family protein [Chitinophagales bacterium]|nr:alpha-keto acid decarboxylase family protein [Chitinophagales bacterium]
MPETKTMTVANYLLTRLLQLNVTEVFQIPGDYVKHFTQALEYFEGIETIGAINELDAAYAADAYARTRGLAAVSLQYGVSTYSALNAIAGAYVERAPVVVISATPGADARNLTDMYGMLFHHSTGNLAADEEIYRHVTVGAVTLSTSEGAPEIIDALLIEALTHQRPVYIACYKEVWAEPCAAPSPEPLQARVVKSEPRQLENAVAQAWSMISAAKNPLILAGVEVLRHGLSPLLEQLIGASGILYTTTSLGKTVLDEGGDKFIGTYSDAASAGAVLDIVKASDCVITLGAIMTDDYLLLVTNKYADMVLCTTDSMRAGYFKYEGVGLKDFMQALLLKFETDKAYPLKTIAPPPPQFPEPWVSASDPRWNGQPEVITFNRFFQQLTKFWNDNNLMKDSVLTLGVSSSMYVATNIYGMAQGSFVSSAAWQIIGYETGAAAGAQLGSGKRAWTVAGDGGFMMLCQSLSTLSRNNLDAVIFVMSNGVYAIEQVYVDVNSFNDGPDAPPFDAFDVLPKWDYMALAQAFGAEGYRAETVSELNAVLAKLKTRSSKPILVEVKIPEKDLPQQMKRLGNEQFPGPIVSY